MKSAYELAMERLNAADPDGVKSLTEKQKSQIAEIEKKFKAKIAEKEVFLEKQIAEARMQGNHQEETALIKQLSLEKERLNEDKDREKQAVRDS
jgi:predicted nuclease with TOPRIM domain